MGKGRLWGIFVTALLMAACAALSPAYALEAGDWQGQWFKGRLSGRGFCDDGGTMAKNKLKETIYLKIDTAAPNEVDVILFLRDGGQWNYFLMTLEREMGGYDRGVFSTHLTITDGGETSDVYLVFLLAGQENKKTGELKKGALKTICGAQIGYCTMSISVKARTIKESTVPQDVKDALP